MDKKEFINRRDAIKEDFRVRVDKEGDSLSVEAEGENSQEFFDFARCLFGDNFDSFNCDFDNPVQPEKQVVAEIPEVNFDYKAEDQIADVEDPFIAFDEEPIEEAPAEEHTEETTEEPIEEPKDENQPMDMINGRLVPAKDPTASEVEIDDEEELEEDLKEQKYDCYYKDEFVGSVYAKSEEEAYRKMEEVWPEFNYGEYDGVAYVVLSDYSEDDFLKAFGEAFYGKRKDLKEAGLGEATPEEDHKETSQPEEPRQSKEEKALWDKLSDNNCGPAFEYELTYDARDYENYKTKPGERQTSDGDYVRTGSVFIGTYNGDFWYYKAPTYEDVLEFLGEDHLTEEGAERFIADDKKKEPEFIKFLTNKYEDEAVEKFYKDLENGEYDDRLDWDEEWPELDYDD